MKLIEQNKSMLHRRIRHHSEKKKQLIFWSHPENEILQHLNTREEGLTDEEATRRKISDTSVHLQSPYKHDLILLFSQFKSPLVLILVMAVILSSVLGEYTNSIIILMIILSSGLVGFWQERRAQQATRTLLEMVQLKTSVLRNGSEKEIPTHEVVLGDIVILNAGDIIPADCRILESKDLHVNEAALTGESFPAEKEVGIMPINTDLNKRTNCVFQGTNVINGSAKVVVVALGNQTVFGALAENLQKQYPETAFEKGFKKFGYLLMKVTLVIALVIISLNVYVGKPVIDSVLFGLSLALGMTPELLPAIVTVTLATGAKRMADKQVIVKRLSSIQNFGSIDVLCADKTGTLTEGTVKVHATYDMRGEHSEKVKLYAFLNAYFETGFTNPLDEALRAMTPDVIGYTKVDEVPYDFMRKRLSMVVAYKDRHIMITKGAVKNIMEICDRAEVNQGIMPISDYATQIFNRYESFSADGFRTIGLCYKDITGDPVINRDDEVNMIFLGFIVLADPPKPGVERSLLQLKNSGITIKLITGDNRQVASYISQQIGLGASGILTGGDLRVMSDEALVQKVMDIQVFAETEPYQKERIVRALKKAGCVVGYLGDGINDVSAMKAADISISVDGAVDVAKETADIILLQKNLDILKDGIHEGRKTFINTMKYIYITSSANFGNMFSMAGISTLIPFLPLLPKQILLTNFITDFPAMAISKDHVDEETILRPARWNTTLIKKFMIIFGIESSLFDILTFTVLLYTFKAQGALFQTSWFVESVVTEILILMIIRTHRPIFRSIPGTYLIWISASLIAITCSLPYLPFHEALGFVSLPVNIIIGMVVIALAYGVVTEYTKALFFKKFDLT